MGLADTVRSAVATAHNATADLQGSVSHEAWISQAGDGEPTYAAAASRPALVEQKFVLRQRRDGRLVPTFAKLTFLQVVPANGAAGRREPIDPRDRLTLPDGSSGHIVDIEGLTDPDTTRPFLLEVWLGDGGGS